MDLQKLIDKHLRKRSILSYLLAPLGIGYGSVQYIRRVFYTLGLFKSYKSDIKIISVGNIVSGGAGKTPFTIFLANLLTRKGFKIIVSHRGYKGAYEDINKFISNGKEVFEEAKLAGDEPLLLAQKLSNIPVIVGKDRRKSLELIESEYPDTDFVILDDSFQHLKVKHDYDFLIFNSGFGLGNGFTLPAGLLREFTCAMNKASFLIWNQLDDKNIPLQLLNSGVDILKFNYQPLALYDSQNKNVEVSELNKGRNALLSGIGYPEGFEKSCREYGIVFTKHFKLTDHFAYDDPEIIEQIKTSYAKGNFNSLIITEKDYVKIKQLQDFPIPYVVLAVELSPTDKSIEEQILERIKV